MSADEPNSPMGPEAADPLHEQFGARIEQLNRDGAWPWLTDGLPYVGLNDQGETEWVDPSDPRAHPS